MAFSVLSSATSLLAVLSCLVWSCGFILSCLDAAGPNHLNGTEHQGPNHLYGTGHHAALCLASRVPPHRPDGLGRLSPPPHCLTMKGREREPFLPTGLRLPYRPDGRGSLRDRRLTTCFIVLVLVLVLHSVVA